MTSDSSTASVGGAAGASGVGFQNRVFAWTASCLVAEEPLQVPLVPGIVVQVGAQTGFEVDDVAVLTDAGGGVFVQAKVGLGLGAANDSPLSKALGQAVLQYLDGRVPDVGTTGGRPLDPARDCIVLCTDYSAPATVRNDLAVALRRVASQPAGTPFGSELTAKQADALKVACAHSRRLWAAARGVDPSDEDLRNFFKTLQVLILDLDDGRKDQQSAIGVLHRGLAEPSKASVAWSILLDEAQAASSAREWRDRTSLVIALSQRGLSATLPVRHALDIGLIRERSAANLRALQAEARLPVGAGLFISRSVAQALRESTGRQHVLIVGDAGTGKSAVIQDLATSRLTSEEVVVLRATDVSGTNRLATQASLQEVLRAWSGPPGLIVIDGVDALRGSEDRETLSATVGALAGTRWQVAATARSFDTQNSQPLQRAFAGEPVSTDATMIDVRLARVRHLLVGDLSDEDLNREMAAPMPLALLLADASPDLRRLLRNPFNLRLAAELADTLTTSRHSQLLQVRNRAELLGRYWDWRIRHADRAAREALLKRLASSMVRGRRLQVVEAEPTVLGTDSAALDSLLSQGVLTALDGPIRGVGRVLTFSHNILFDYATAIYVLYHPLQPMELVTQLDGDPTLPLVARPSFDLLVDLLWHSRTVDGFWPTALALAGSEHVLASLAVASRLVNLAHAADDLLELTASTSDAQGTAELLPRQRLVGQAIGAFRARAVLPDASNAVLPLATLAHRLAQNANASYADAALATDLFLALQSRAPVTTDNPGAAGTAERCNTVARLLDAARSDPPRMERIAGVLARQLEHVIGISAEVRGALKRLLDDYAALSQWGGTVLTWFPEAVLPALRADPRLARMLAVTSLTFEETRDEDVAFGGSSILPLRESRKQQAQHAAYRLGELYPEVCSADIVTAAEIISDAFGGADSPDDPQRWPMTAHGAAGWLEHGYGFGLDRYGQDDEEKMLSALAVAVSEQQGASREVVTLLVTRVHAPSVWAGLMHNPTFPDKLGRAVLPAFESGTLLAHPDTFSEAAALLKVAALEGTVPHQRLENAVLAAFRLVDANGRSQYVKDVLVGCLDADAISDDSLAAHLGQLDDDPPAIPPPSSMMAEARSWSPVDSLLENGVALAPEVEAAARELHRLLNELSDNKPAEPDSISNLAAALANAVDIFASATLVPSRLRSLQVEAASRLARDSSITPQNPYGRLVINLLMEAADSPDAGQFLS